VIIIFGTVMYAWIECEKTAFLRHFYLKTKILPRQARDKHRENSKIDYRFLAGRGCWMRQRVSAHVA
jgi:hypothetical protein